MTKGQSHRMLEYRDTLGEDLVQPIHLADEEIKAQIDCDLSKIIQ